MEKIEALEDAIEKKSLVGIYSVFYTIAHGDRNFSSNKFRCVLDYVKRQNIKGFMQEFDGEEFEPEEKWDENYWALVASSLMDNFCEERINHLEAVGRKVYPVKVIEQSKTSGNIRNTNNSVEIPNFKVDKKESANKEHRTRLITEEQKRGVKFGHTNRTNKDDGGFLSKIFGFGTRR